MVSFFIDHILTRSEKASNWMFETMLLGIFYLMKTKRFLMPSFRRRLKEKDFTAQIKVRGDAIGRTFTFKSGKVFSEKKTITDADMSMIFRDTASAVQLMTAPTNYLKQINAMKNFVVDVEGDDEDAVWFMQTLKMLQHLRAQPRYGIAQGNGVVRYVNNTNGGPVFVYVKKRPHHPHYPHHFRRTGRPTLDHPGPRQKFHAAAQGNGQPVCVRTQIPDLLQGPPPLSHETRGFRSQRRTQLPQPRHLRIRTHILGQGPGYRRRGDQTGQTRARAGRHHERQRLPPHLGQPGLLAQRQDTFHELHRLQPRGAQPGQLGRLVLGRHAPLGQQHPQRRHRHLRHGGRLP